jgi:hypothetical protein
MKATKPLIVLVPGAFHKPDAYSVLLSLLTERGFEIITPSLAVACDGNLDQGLSHLDDVSNIHAQLLPRLDEGAWAIVLSHSYGGLPAVDSIEHHTVRERAVRGLKGGIIAYIATCAVVYPTRNKGLLGDDTKFQPASYHIIKVGSPLVIRCIQDV